MSGKEVKTPWAYAEVTIIIEKPIEGKTMEDTVKELYGSNIASRTLTWILKINDYTIVDR